MTYRITVVIDGETYEVARDVPAEELEGELQHLTRRHEYKNVTRFELQETEE
jgi:hypothetical protein